MPIFSFCAARPKQGCDCKMICPNCDVYAVTNGTLRIPERKRGKIVSVFCHGDRAEGVTLQGLKYPLNGATLTCDSPLGVSNGNDGGTARDHRDKRYAAGVCDPLMK